MKTLNYLNALILTLAMTMSGKASAYNESLSAKTHLKNGSGITEILTNNWVSVPADKNVRLVVKSSYAVVANVGVKLFKQAAPNQIVQVGSGEVLDFANGLRKSKEFTLDEGDSYALAFQGEAVGVPVVVGQAQTKPFTISVRLEDQDGRTILDFGDIPVRYAGKLQKQIPGTNAYEIIEGTMNLSDTLINGTLHLKAISTK